MNPRSTGLRAALAACAAAALLCLAAPAAPAVEPIAEFNGANGPEFEGPCGLAVDGYSNLYLANHYKSSINLYRPALGAPFRILGVDPASGPCGLAVDSFGRLYVNGFHRNVVRLTPSFFPPGPSVTYGPPAVIDSADSTGVAVDPASGRVYVDDRTYISAYESSGSPVEIAGKPLHLGEGTLANGYGLAFASPPAPNAGRIYVADAAAGVIKAYDPALDTVNPVQVIDGHELPGGGFVSLRDSALAVDRANGDLYVADLLQPNGYERPEAAIYAFDAGGAYVGRLRYNVIDARPPGLAIDNSNSPNQGRIYVTSGNTDGALLYVYPAGAADTGGAQCAPGGPCPTSSTPPVAPPPLSSRAIEAPSRDALAGDTSPAPAFGPWRSSRRGRGCRPSATRKHRCRLHRSGHRARQ